MNDSFPKYVLAFLAIIYLLSCIAEIAMVKDGAAAVFESIRTVVPHLAMFLLGIWFGRK